LGTEHLPFRLVFKASLCYVNDETVNELQRLLYAA
jgi:hypothetical protein